MRTRLDVPFFEGADKPLLGQAMDASFVSTNLKLASAYALCRFF